MSDETYYLPRTNNSLAVRGYLTACRKCGRKVLVEMSMIGSTHHVGVAVTCGECLILSDQLRKEQPEIVSKIESWLHGACEKTSNQS
jgi:hypothetical protein